MGDAPSRERMRGVELNQRGPRVIGVEQHGFRRRSRARCRALGEQAGVARVLHVDHAEMPRRAQQALRRLGILDRDDAIGDLDQGAGEMPGLDAAGGEGIGEIFARAAEIKQEIDADIVADQRDDADHRELVALLARARALRAGEHRIELVEDLHQHAGHGHQDEIAIDDMAELMRHDGALLLVAEELENALRHHDARIGAQQAIGEGGGVAVGDEADPGRGEAIVVGHLMDELVNAGIALLDRGVVEEFEAVEPTERQVRQPRADQPDQQIDDDGEPDGDGEIDLAGGHHGREHEADYHADQDAEGDERGEDETSHDDPPKTAPKRAESLAVAGQRRCQIHRERDQGIISPRRGRIGRACRPRRRTRSACRRPARSSWRPRAWRRSSFPVGSAQGSPSASSRAGRS